MIFDVGIIGVGIVGASIAYSLAPKRRVLLLETESAAGYHATGRSAALFTEAYGPAGVRALTRASREFLASPPAGFANSALLRARGSLLIASAEQAGDIDRAYSQLIAEGRNVLRLDCAESLKQVPVLRPECAHDAILNPDAFEIDVDVLLQGFLRGAKSHGAVLLTNCGLTRLARDAQGWNLETPDGQYRVTQLVNAAGAWADQVAAMAGVAPLELEPRRRSCFLFDPPSELDSDRWPAVMACDESWYFKPEAKLLLGSPANVEPSYPHDVMPEDLDIAVGVERIEAATTLTIGRPRRAWAGLRTFVPDGEPVCGPDPADHSFIWAAALGGYGIQTAPAVGALVAAQILGEQFVGELAKQKSYLPLVSRSRNSLAEGQSRR